MNLSILEERLKHELPDSYEETIEEEFSKFEMETSRVSQDKDKVGQATLTKREVQKAPTTNQHGEHGLTVIELQYVKAAALEYGVREWLDYVDPELTAEENVNIMREHSTEKGVTARELTHLR